MKKEIVLIFMSVITAIFLLFFQFRTRKITVKSSLNCDCVREIVSKNNSENSICDEFSGLRPKRQKIVSYSFYGNSREKIVKNRYLDEIKVRSEEIKNFYPNFVSLV